jgi:hypothetical protein
MTSESKKRVCYFYDGKTLQILDLSEISIELLTTIHQQMLEITIMAQGILWSLTESGLYKKMEIYASIPFFTRIE